MVYLIINQAILAGMPTILERKSTAQDLSFIVSYGRPINGFPARRDEAVRLVLSIVSY